MSRVRLAYLALALFGAFLLVGVGNVGYTNYVDQRRVEGEREAAAARALQSEQTRQLVCNLALSQIEVFSGSTTPVGMKALASWSALAGSFNCR